MKASLKIAILGIALGIIIAGFMVMGSTKATDEGIDKTGETAVRADTALAADIQDGEIKIITLEHKTGADPKEDEMPKYEPAQTDIEMLARLIWGEARGVKSTTEKAAVVWCVLNRVDSTGYACGGTIEHVITFQGQFTGYSEDFPVTQEHMAIARDVLIRWFAEKDGYTEVGRVLPKEYQWFIGDGTRNHFTDEWKGGNTWDWSLRSPYKD